MESSSASSFAIPNFIWGWCLIFLPQLSVYKSFYTPVQRFLFIQKLLYSWPKISAYKSFNTPDQRFLPIVSIISSLYNLPEPYLSISTWCIRLFLVLYLKCLHFFDTHCSICSHLFSEDAQTISIYCTEFFSLKALLSVFPLCFTLYLYLSIKTSILTMTFLQILSSFFYLKYWAGLWAIH